MAILPNTEKSAWQKKLAEKATFEDWQSVLISLPMLNKGLIYFKNASK